MTYLHTPLLMLPSIKNISIKNIEDISSNFKILQISGKYYLVLKRYFQNASKKKFDELYVDSYTKIESIKLDPLNITKFGGVYGSADDFIIDMNGIDNFRFAKSLHFYDSFIRAFVQNFNLLSSDASYLRFGAAGAECNDKHPGGEVFEYQFIKGDSCEGSSQSISGFLVNEYSKSIPLSYDEKVLRDDRTVYSHTAWLKQSNTYDTTSYYLKVQCSCSNQSILDIINTIAKYLGMSAYAIQIYAKSIESTVNSNIQIKGRVLKHIPQKAFIKLQEATDIAIEKTFELPSDARLLAVGTKYDRYEPDWEVFTNGHKYEPRGHLHATIERDKKDVDSIHETFHLRDMWGSPNSEIKVVLTPINIIYRMYPIHMENGTWICDSNNVNIKYIIHDIVERDNE